MGAKENIVPFDQLKLETFSGSVIDTIIPLVDQYHLAELKQQQLRAKGITPPINLQEQKTQSEHEIIFIVHEGETSNN